MANKDLYKEILRKIFGITPYKVEYLISEEGESKASITLLWEKARINNETFKQMKGTVKVEAQGTLGHHNICRA